MANLIYTSISSLDGYIEDAGGHFDWSAPDEEVHAFVNDLERPIGTYLCGRRMYEVMKFWETDAAVDGQPPTMRDYAEIWRSAKKVVYSTTLQGVQSERTRIERDFDPAEITQIKADAEEDLSIGGAELAGLAIAAGLVDEFHLFLTPFIVGGGKRSLPDGCRLDLELIDERRFSNGTVHMHLRPRS